MLIPYDGILSPFLRRKRTRVALPYVQGRVVDIGCGCGELARHVDSARYVGVDKDTTIVHVARTMYPHHTFYTMDEFYNVTNRATKFDTVASLAVLEHVENPLDFMLFLKSLLAENGKIVITTPHPRSEAIQSLGGKIGLFGSHAHQEHKKLFDAQDAAELMNSTDIQIVTGKTFLFGMNQLFVLGSKK